MKNKIKYLQMSFALLFSFFIASCSSDDDSGDPCDDLICTQGRCVAGECETLKTIWVYRITLQDFPRTTPDNENWDASTGGSLPDIYYSFTDGSATLEDSDIRCENVGLTESCIFTTSDGVNTLGLDRLTSFHILEFWDKDDLSSDDFIGEVRFFPLTSARNDDFPSVLTIKNGDMWVDFEVTYEFE